MSAVANTIFDEFVANRVRATFNASLRFVRHEQAQYSAVLVSDGTNTFALCHVEDTPLTLWIQGTQWEALTSSLDATRYGSHPELSFHLQDPRVVFMPVNAAEAQKLGGKIYHISNTPFKFQDVVLVGAGEGYYGECKFEIDLNAPAYVKLDRSVLKGLFGKFNPSRGDLVFSRTGELLGIMANNTYCLLMHNFNGMATFNFGQDVRAPKAPGAHWPRSIRLSNRCRQAAINPRSDRGSGSVLRDSADGRSFADRAKTFCSRSVVRARGFSRISFPAPRSSEQAIERFARDIAREGPGLPAKQTTAQSLIRVHRQPRGQWDFLRTGLQDVADFAKQLFLLSLVLAARRAQASYSSRSWL
jgi:hypothetical protein